jgi:hypothetical protein
MGRPPGPVAPVATRMARRATSRPWPRKAAGAGASAPGRSDRKSSRCLEIRLFFDLGRRRSGSVPGLSYRGSPSPYRGSGRRRKRVERSYRGSETLDPPPETLDRGSERPDLAPGRRNPGPGLPDRGAGCGDPDPGRPYRGPEPLDPLPPWPDRGSGSRYRWVSASRSVPGSARSRVKRPRKRVRTLNPRVRPSPKRRGSLRSLPSRSRNRARRSRSTVSRCMSEPTRRRKARRRSRSGVGSRASLVRSDRAASRPRLSAPPRHHSAVSRSRRAPPQPAPRRRRQPVLHGSGLDPTGGRARRPARRLSTPDTPAYRVLGGTIYATWSSCRSVFVVDGGMSTGFIRVNIRDLAITLRATLAQSEALRNLI